ncbi:MAG: AraC family transcriptional regulator [Puia sp.]|nr:AraC family transcriptional regulator [Puia sp.]
MKPPDLKFPHVETPFDQWHAEKLPVGIDLLCFKQSQTALDLVLPVFEKEGFILTFLDYTGELEIATRDRDPFFTASPGTGLLTDAADPLILKSSGPVTVSAVMISMPGHWISRFMKGNDNFAKIAEAVRTRGKAVTAVLGRKELPLLSSLIDTKRAANTDGTGQQNLTLHLIEYFLCHCHKNFFKDELSKVIKNDEDINLVREAESYILEGYCSDTFTVDTILKKTYTSYHKLNFLFKSIHGMTISEYIRNKRIERSKEMIADHAKSISQIAYEIGYSSISNYILAFKKIYRITPGKYKKQMERIA